MLNIKIRRPLKHGETQESGQTRDAQCTTQRQGARLFSLTRRIAVFQAAWQETPCA